MNKKFNDTKYFKLSQNNHEKTQENKCNNLTVKDLEDNDVKNLQYENVYKSSVESSNNTKLDNERSSIKKSKKIKEIDDKEVAYLSTENDRSHQSTIQNEIQKQNSIF